MTANPPRPMAVVFDTGLRVPLAVYRFKLLHPLLARFGRFVLQGRARRRYFVMPGDYVSDYTTRFGSFEAEEIAVARQVCRHAFDTERLAHGTMVDVGCHIGNYSVELGADFGAVLAVDAVQAYANVAAPTWRGTAWQRDRSSSALPSPTTRARCNCRWNDTATWDTRGCRRARQMPPTLWKPSNP